MNTDAKRLKRAIQYTKQNTKQFSESMGIRQPSKLYNVLNGKNKLSENLAKSITTFYPDISFDWLLTGTGTMLAHRPTDPIHHKIKALEVEIAQLKKLQGLNTFLEKLK